MACQIEADGLVYPCVTLVNKFKALNLREVGFKKAWENLKIAIVRRVMLFAIMSLTAFSG